MRYEELEKVVRKLAELSSSLRRVPGVSREDMDAILWATGKLRSALRKRRKHGKKKAEQKTIRGASCPVCGSLNVSIEAVFEEVTLVCNECGTTKRG